MVASEPPQHHEVLDHIELLTKKLVNFCENADLVGKSSTGDKLRSTVCLDISCPCDGRHPVWSPMVCEDDGVYQILCHGETSRKVTVSAGIGVKHLCQLWYIFEVIQELLTTGRTATQREL